MEFAQLSVGVGVFLVYDDGIIDLWVPAFVGCVGSLRRDSCAHIVFLDVPVPCFVAFVNDVSSSYPGVALVAVRDSDKLCFDI